jgi:putative membrane protein (TIGR04086 family)
MRIREVGEKVMQMLKCLLASYIVTGLLLLGLTFLVYKFELDEQVVLGSIVAIYVVSTFVGGFIIGKLMGKRKFLWGMMLGFAYFALLLLISYGVYREFNTNGLNVITTVLLCVGGGMLGGMLS